MKYIDILKPERVNRTPDSTLTIFDEKNFSSHGFQIKKVELRLFKEKNDKNLGQFSLITSLVDTDKGSIEMLYDEGYRGNNALQDAKEFVVSNMGISGLILRSIISLENEIKKHHT